MQLQKTHMRSDGDNMVVGIKDAAKLMGISIVACCAVFVCTMFLNFNLDLVSIKKEIISQQALFFYDAQVSTAKVISSVSGGCLLITSIIMLLFYIKHYIDTHKKELGILKALGYSNMKIAKNFWVFGISVFIGTVIGFIGAFFIMPLFYELQNEDNILPEISIQFHPILLLCLVIVPTIAFTILSILYAFFQLKKTVLELLKDDLQNSSQIRQHKEHKDTENSFLNELKKSTLQSKKVLVFFIVFASFCFSAMTQMSFSMKELSSIMMGVMILLIGIILACTTLFLAITTVINGNTKTIAMMRVFGYSQKECCNALLSGYRPMAYLGFIIGTLYQYTLLKIMVFVVFKDIVGVPEYEFDFPAMVISLVSFLVIYEIIMYCYSEKIKKISIKEIMLE